MQKIVAICLLLAVAISTADAKWEAMVASTYSHGSIGSSEVSSAAFESSTNQVYVLDKAREAVDILSLNSDDELSFVATLDTGNRVEAMALNGDGLLALSFGAAVSTNNGRVAFYSTRQSNTPELQSQVTVGPSPEAIAFSPNGNVLAVSNEGEATENDDDDVRTVSFAPLNSMTLPEGIILVEPAHKPDDDDEPTTVAQFMAPEALSFRDSDTLFVNCQDNNALIRIDVSDGEIEELFSWGFGDRSRDGNGLDTSDRDGGINIRTWDNLRAARGPEGIVAHGSRIFSANKGTTAYIERGAAQRVNSLSSDDFDSDAFPDVDAIQDDAALGRLYVLNGYGLNDDGDFESLIALGSRGVSAMSTSGEITYDSGELIEQAIAAATATNFNSESGAQPSFDQTSPERGCQPYGIAHGHLGGEEFLFVTLFDQGGVVAFNAEDEDDLDLEFYFSERDFSTTVANAGGLGTISVQFVSASDAPGDEDLLIVVNEVSATTTVLALMDDSAASALSLSIGGALVLAILSLIL